MNRHDFQQLAELRLRDAEVLLGAGCFDGAFYLPGYVVECALKACIAKQTKEFDFPPKDAAAVYSHNLKNLLNASALADAHLEQKRVSADFDENWKIVQIWTEGSRYEKGRSEKEAQDFFSAVTGDEGVLTWLKKFW